MKIAGCSNFDNQNIHKFVQPGTLNVRLSIIIVLGHVLYVCPFKLYRMICKYLVINDIVPC